jgi:hypothetical protein
MKTLLIIILSFSLCQAFENPQTGAVLAYYAINLAAVVGVSVVVYYTVKSIVKHSHPAPNSADTTSAGGKK